MRHPKNTVILTHGDVDGLCAAAIAKTSYPKAEIEFANPPDFLSILDRLSGYDRVIILDLGIDKIQKDEAIAAFRKLSTTSSIIYIDHHLRPPGLTKSSLACNEVYRTDASTSELAWEFFKPAASHDFIAVLGAIGDYEERTPQIQGLIEKYNERKVYPEALFLEWALMVSEDSFKRGVVEELAQGKWPYQMSIMDKEADAIVRRQRTLERYVRDKAEEICERVMLIRDPPFKATGPAATLLTKLDNVDITIASRIDGNHVYLSLRRHEDLDINLAALIEESVSKFGGVGGGHKEAAGGKIPVERFDEFLQEIRRMLPDGHLKRIKKLDVGSLDKKTIERKLFKEIIHSRRTEEILWIKNKAIESSISAIAIADIEGAIIYVNPSSIKLWGYDDENDLLGRSFVKFFQDTEKASDVLDALRNGRISMGETVAVKKDGSAFNVQITASTITDEAGKPICIMGSFIDITERKKAEEKLKESEEKYRAIVENATDQIFMLDKEYRFISINKTGARLSNKTPSELIGMSISKMFPEETMQRFMENCREVFEKGESQSIEEKMVIENREFYNHTILSPVKDSEGNVIAIAGVVRDITKRKRAEDALKESEQKFRAIFDSANDGILVADMETKKFKLSNKAICKMLGYSQEDIKNLETKDIHPKEDFPHVMEQFERQAKREIEVTENTPMKRRDGSVFYADISSSPIILNGKTCLVSVFRDVTERKRIENRIRTEREIYRSIALAANRSKTVEELCELALKGIQTAINCDMLSAMIYRESENALLSVAQVGYPEDLYQRTVERQDLKEKSRVAAQAARERKSVYVDDVKTSKLTSYAHDLVTKYDISTLYAVPLLCSGKLQGVLEVLTTGDRKLSEENREVLDMISEELAGGIAKAKIEEQLVTVKEAFGWIAVPTKGAPPLYPHL